MTKTSFGKKYYDMKAASDLLGITEVTMQSYKKNISCTKIGNKFWFSEDSLKSFVEGGGTHRQVAHS